LWVNGKQFSKVDHAANIRMGAAVSKIRHHRTEHHLAGNIGQKSLDTLAIPATATECERTFNNAKKLATPERNCLANDVLRRVNASKWRDCGVIKLRHWFGNSGVASFSTKPAVRCVRREMLVLYSVVSKDD
jgi:hypothetical protein